MLRQPCVVGIWTQDRSTYSFARYYCRRHSHRRRHRHPQLRPRLRRRQSRLRRLRSCLGHLHYHFPHLWHKIRLIPVAVSRLYGCIEPKIVKVLTRHTDGAVTLIVQTFISSSLRFALIRRVIQQETVLLIRHTYCTRQRLVFRQEGHSSILGGKSDDGEWC